MNLQIINFTNNKNEINKKYLCKYHNGQNIMPSIKWKKVNGAKSYIIIFEDIKAKTEDGKCNFIHLYIKYINENIDHIDELNFDNKTLNILKNKFNSKNLIFGKNHSDTYGYYGPCNPHNYIHNYIFHIYALNNIIINIKDKICSSQEFEKEYGEYIIKKDLKEFSYIQKK
jgi:Raf kinase inhibitor-like YbhB/YbcL family protein